MVDGEVRSTRDPVDAREALELLEGVRDLYVARGRTTIHRDLTGDERPSDEEILALVLGRSGTLRAPALRRGTTFVVGFNAHLLSQSLL